MGLEYFRYYTRWVDHANRRRYQVPADPWRLVRVDPGQVTRFDGVSLKWGLGRVRGGDWDRPENCRELDETRLFRGLEQRFGDGRAWPDTDYYDWARERLADRETFHGHADLDAFLDSRDDLYRRIREEGYRPNRGRVYDGPSETDRISDLEPIVTIGRDGEVIWTEGFHRLAFARLLDVDEVPVYVLRRHERWQQRRDDLLGDDTSSAPSTGSVETTDHPDLRPGRAPDAPD